MNWKAALWWAGMLGRDWEINQKSNLVKCTLIHKTIPKPTIIHNIFHISSFRFLCTNQTTNKWKHSRSPTLLSYHSDFPQTMTCFPWDSLPLSCTVFFDASGPCHDSPVYLQIYTLLPSTTSSLWIKCPLFLGLPSSFKATDYCIHPNNSLQSTTPSLESPFWSPDQSHEPPSTRALALCTLVPLCT